MEEKVVGGKEKKYVLYTVVGEERGRAGVGVWVVRVLLGTLLLVALAVVPYLSLRLAQVSDRTLVVFQPVPVRNHSLHHHRGANHVVEHSKLGHVDVVSILKSAALTKENYTADSGNDTTKTAANITSTTGNTSNNIVTLHESAVTLAVMEDTNATRNKDNDDDDSDDDDDDDDEDDDEDNDADKDKSSEKNDDDDKKNADESTTTEESVGTSDSPPSATQAAAVTVHASSVAPPVVHKNATVAVNTTPAPQHKSNTTSATPSTSLAPHQVTTSAATTPHAPPNTTGKSSPAKVANVSSTTSTKAPNTTTTKSTPTSTTSTSTRRPLSHKLVYVATSASGNHVGGFCVWKTDQNITRWAYFYENIPIEYQSHQDSSDHEMRGMLAAVRTWSPLWNDHHVVLRSHHPAIKGSDHPTRHALTHELEQLSEGLFTYEMEWRLRKTDRLVDISYCLSRLHRDYAHWYRTFQGRVDELLGRQDWGVARMKNRAHVTQEAFQTDYPDEDYNSIPPKN